MPDLPASNRLRIGRYNEPNRIYHLTTNTLDRTPIFEDFRLGRLVVQQFRNAQSQGLVTSLAWVVMPDHFHWLISLDKGSLADLMFDAPGEIQKHPGGQCGSWSTGTPMATRLS